MRGVLTRKDYGNISKKWEIQFEQGEEIWMNKMVH